jgi:hypothetical protein
VGPFLRAVPLAFNNFLLRLKKKRVPFNKMLILLPRCLQHATCTHNVVESIENCKMCGKCPTAEIAKLAKKYGIPTGLATGSLLARELVKKYRPELIIAVACERELVQGIFSVFPRPVYAVYNERPNGPCKNTQVNPHDVESAILHFCLESSISGEAKK